MIRAAVAFAALMVVWPFLATAQTPTRVLSGEHDTFSRLVFAYQRLSGWQLNQGADGLAQIQFDAGLPPLDLSDVFKRIPRTRLVDIEQRGTALALTLGCDCSIDVMRLGSNHMVIDIRDAREGPRATLAPIDLTSAILRSSILLRPFDLPDAIPTGPRRDLLLRPETAGDPRRHVQIRDTAAGAPEAPPAGAPPVATCRFERIAHDHLMADPEAALEKLPVARLAATDVTGQMRADGARDIAELYLDIGWGQEALLTLSTLRETDLHRIALASILDGASPPPGADPDPDCGPASTLSAMLAGLEPEDVRRIDGRVLARFMADLPVSRSRDLEPRVRQALEAADAETALAFLQLPEPPPPSPADLAGTDFDAGMAIIDSLHSHYSDPSQVPEPLLVNALAFRQSMPENQARERLDQVLVPTLAASGHVVDAIGLLEDSTVSAETVLTAALDHLPAGQAAEAAMRLHSVIDRTHPVAGRAADLFSTYGLDTVAALFAPPPTPMPALIETRASPPRQAPGDPWLAGRFEDLAQAEATEVPAPRATVARLVAERNAQPQTAEVGDLARAEAELASATALRESLTTLLAEPSS